MSIAVVERPDKGDATATEGPLGLPTISASALHELLLEMHAAANTTRRRFMDALRALDEGRLYIRLGYPTIAAYGEATFRFQKSQTYEYLRVSRAFEELPAIASAYEAGEISFSLAAELTRVAVPATEEEWLELARKRRPGEVRAEIRYALKNERHRPRGEGGFGLPQLPVKVVLEFPPEDHAIVEQALLATADEMAAGMDGERPSQEQVLVYLAIRRLEEQAVPADEVSVDELSGDGVQTEENGCGEVTSRSSPTYTVVFTRCTECKRTAVETSEGRVEIEPGSLARFEGSAERIEIDEPAEMPTSSGASGRTPPESAGERDRPNTPKLRRLVRARAGGRCENPYCRFPTRGAGHAHHIVFRSQGGATELANEVHLCERCHSLVHAGCLSIAGEVESGLTWQPRGLDIARRIRDEFEQARSWPQVRAVFRHSGIAPGGSAVHPRVAASTVSPGSRGDLEQQPDEQKRETTERDRQAGDEKHLAEGTILAGTHVGQNAAEAERREEERWQRYQHAEDPGDDETEFENPHE